MYMNSLLCELLVQNHNIANNLPVFDLLDSSFSLFNEEVGEMSFSVLARLMYSKSHEVDLEIVNKLFILVHEYAALDDDMVADLDKQGMRNGFLKVDLKGEAAEATKSYMKTVVRQLRCNQFQIYTGESTYGNPVFMPTGKKDVIKWTTRPVKPLLWVNNIQNLLESAFKKLKISLEKPVEYLYKFWPEFQNMGDPCESKESIGLQITSYSGEENEVMTLDRYDEYDTGDRNSSCSQSEDEDRPLAQDPVVRQIKFTRAMDKFPAKTGRAWHANDNVWTIDFPERNEDDTAWRITKGCILRRAVKGKKKNAIATPIDCERVQCVERGGEIEVFDIQKTNLDRSLAIAESRLRSILRELGVAEAQQEQGIDYDNPPIMQLRNKNIEEQNRVWKSIQDEDHQAQW